MVTLIALAADETTERVTYSPIALAVTVAAAVALSVFLDRQSRKKKDKMRRFMEENSTGEDTAADTDTEDTIPKE